TSRTGAAPFKRFLPTDHTSPPFGSMGRYIYSTSPPVIGSASSKALRRRPVWRFLPTASSSLDPRLTEGSVFGTRQRASESNTSQYPENLILGLNFSPCVFHPTPERSRPAHGGAHRPFGTGNWQRQTCGRPTTLRYGTLATDGTLVTWRTWSVLII